LSCAGCAIRRPAAWAAILRCSNLYCIAICLLSRAGGVIQPSFHAYPVNSHTH
jgi:hypothetical protein